MPADSFESPLTLAACGGHVELAMLLLERGANIEEVNRLFLIIIIIIIVAVIITIITVITVIITRSTTRATPP